MKPIAISPSRATAAFFLGRYGDTDAPAAIVSSETLDGRTGSGLDPCAAWQIRFELEPGDAFECTFLLGETPDRDVAADLVRKYADPLHTQQALAEVRQFWLHLLSAVNIETPNREIDLNGQWLADVSKLKLPYVGPLGVLPTGRSLWFSRSTSGLRRAAASTPGSYQGSNPSPRQPAICRRRCVALVASRFRLRIANSVFRRSSVAAMCNGRVCRANR